MSDDRDNFVNDDTLSRMESLLQERLNACMDLTVKNLALKRQLDAQIKASLEIVMRNIAFRQTMEEVLAFIDTLATGGLDGNLLRRIDFLMKEKVK